MPEKSNLTYEDWARLGRLVRRELDARLPPGQPNRQASIAGRILTAFENLPGAKTELECFAKEEIEAAAQELSAMAGRDIRLAERPPRLLGAENEPADAEASPDVSAMLASAVERGLLLEDDRGHIKIKELAELLSGQRGSGWTNYSIEQALLETHPVMRIPRAHDFDLVLVRGYSFPRQPGEPS